MASDDHQDSYGRADEPAPHEDTQDAGRSPHAESHGPADLGQPADLAQPSQLGQPTPVGQAAPFGQPAQPGQSGDGGWQGPVGPQWQADAGPEGGGAQGVQAPDGGERAGRSWSGRRTAAAVAVAVGVAAAGGAALATSDSALGIGNVAFTGPGYGSGYGGYGGEGRPGGGDRGPGGHGAMGGLGHALHGEFVVPDGSGGYVTRVMQTGKITAVDSGKITVASDDGYSTTYTITSATAVRGVAAVTDLKVDAVVTVIADQDGAALTIGDRSAMPERGQGGPPDRRQGGGKGAPPNQGTSPGESTPPTPSAPGESSDPSQPSTPQPTT